MEAQLQCPKCGSTQLTADKKGFSGKQAVAGAVLTGGIGLLAGTIGSNKTMITCLSCGYKHKAGTTSQEKYKFDAQKKALEKAKNGDQTGLIVFFGLCTALAIFLSYKLFSNDWNFLGFILAVIALIGVAMTVFTISEESKKRKK